MSAAVEILAPTGLERAKKVVEGLERARVVREPSKAVRDRLLVAWLSDLEVAKRRRELVGQVDLLVKAREGVPFVLVNAKTTKPRSYQALEILTQWSSMVGFYLAPDVKSVRRMVRARAAGADDKLMASALVEDGKLVVWSCEPKRYVVPVAEIPALAEMSPKHLGDLELNESGSRLRWDKADVDLNLDAIRYYTDPKAKKAQDQVRRQEAARYAEAIRAFREERGLKQTDIEGLTERQVRRVEQGESTPRSGTLEKLAAAHGLSMDEYLRELAKRSKG
jgi:hypothetical protein